VVELRWKPNNIVEDLRARHAEITRMWKPVAVIISALTYAGAAYRIVRDYGIYSAPAGCILLLGLLLFKLAPKSGLRLSMLRTAAFLMELLLLALLTFAGISLLHRFGIFPPKASLMLVLWMWFFYFVFFEWRLLATPAKRLLGLRIAFDRGRQSSFNVCFIRTFAVLFAPFIVTDLLGRPFDWPRPIPFPVVSIINASLISLGPISIVAFGGSRGIIDRIVGTSVAETDRQHNRGAREVSFGQWTLLCVSCVGLSLIITAMVYLLFHPHRETGLFTLRPIENTRMVSDLWRNIPVGMRRPPEFIQGIELLEEEPNLFSMKEEPDFQVVLPYKHDLEKLTRMFVVRISLRPGTPLFAKRIVMENFLAWCASWADQNGPPAFAVLQLSTEEDFGLFKLISAEDVILCEMRSGNSVVSFYDGNLEGSRGAFFYVSLDNLRWLMTGDVSDLEAATSPTVP
jgi:uncharacterized RDD family membrane protein YckC